MVSQDMACRRLCLYPWKLSGNVQQIIAVRGRVVTRLYIPVAVRLRLKVFSLRTRNSFTNSVDELRMPEFLNPDE